MNPNKNPTCTNKQWIRQRIFLMSATLVSKTRAQAQKQQSTCARFYNNRVVNRVQDFCTHPPNPKWKGGGERGNLAQHIHRSPMTIGTKNQSPTEDIRWIDLAAHLKDGIDIPPFTQINEREKEINNLSHLLFPSAFCKI